MVDWIGENIYDDRRILALPGKEKEESKSTTDDIWFFTHEH